MKSTKLEENNALILLSTINSNIIKFKEIIL